ncbi:PLP-dependent aminotransferase family protein [uncultured Ruminococcus sp.]|uniref:aminotransferase-like domain-containing protein n=1 Tax=uncultured Ruminococcus sp. TaxID=165186 RepID=UPI002623147F|nr:PLP-dependent aminotransferase family protein [uncultured Ruminococcus sp.]
MQYKFSENVDALQPSAIREILKFTGMPGVISFAAGNPAPEAFPVEEISRISAELFEKDPILALQYNITEGFPELRDVLKARMAEQHCFDETADDLITTSGAQQANELSCKVLLNRGDTMFCESPSFIGSLNAFRSYGVNLVGVELEEDGMNLDALEQAVQENPNPKLVYVIPNFQNPTGRVMSLEKRKGLYELACKYNLIILEDNPYGDLRFAGTPIPSIKSMDTEHRVIYSGTFSKILAPGLRVGYVSAPKEIVSKITVCKQVSDVHTNIWAQAVCAKFLEQTDMDTYLEKLRAVYRRKCNLMADGIRQHFSKRVRWEMPEGGLFLWCTLPEDCDMPAFCKKAVSEYQIAVVPGNAFLVDESAKTSSFRMNFSTPTDEQIVKGTEILGGMTREMLD